MPPGFGKFCSTDFGAEQSKVQSESVYVLGQILGTLMSSETLKSQEKIVEKEILLNQKKAQFMTNQLLFLSFPFIQMFIHNMAFQILLS